MTQKQHILVAHAMTGNNDKISDYNRWHEMTENNDKNEWQGTTTGNDDRRQWQKTMTGNKGRD